MVDRIFNYSREITYGTNSQFGFDYLRDNMSIRPEDQVQRGHSYAIVDEKEYAINDRYILVDDCLDTLQELATHHRRNSKAKILALTGSNGKTTSKELIYSVLKSKLNTIATTGNLNNHIGVPLTL